MTTITIVIYDHNKQAVFISNIKLSVLFVINWTSYWPRNGTHSHLPKGINTAVYPAEVEVSTIELVLSTSLSCVTKMDSRQE